MYIFTSLYLFTRSSEESNYKWICMILESHNIIKTCVIINSFFFFEIITSEHLEEELISGAPGKSFG